MKKLAELKVKSDEEEEDEDFSDAFDLSDEENDSS